MTDEKHHKEYAEAFDAALGAMIPRAEEDVELATPSSEAVAESDRAPEEEPVDDSLDTSEEELSVDAIEDDADEEPTTKKTAWHPSGYEEPDLKAKMDPRFALGTIHILATALFAGLFLLLNTVSLRGTDLWCHVLWGRWILDNAALPRHDMIAPLLSEADVVDSAWLSQMILAGAWRIGGAELLSGILAGVTTLAFLVLARAYYRMAWSTGVMLFVTGGVVLVSWSRLMTLRPETFGFLCFALLLWSLVEHHDFTLAAPPRKRVPWLHAATVLVLFAFWANLHGSFAVGLAVLACLFVGHVAERLWVSESIVAVLRDRVIRDTFILCLAAGLGSLINPYGPRLLIYTATFAGIEHLGDITEWRPLAFFGIGGREFIASIIVFMFLLRLSRARLPWAHVLVLGLLAYASLSGIRMIAWYAAAFGFVVAPHVADVASQIIPAARRRRQRPIPLPEGEDDTLKAVPKGRTFYHTLVCGLVIWIALVLSPVGQLLFQRPPRPLEAVLDRDTPVAAVRYLRENPPPRGLAFAPQWWGDWVAMDGPEGLSPMMTTNMHLCPPETWRDYQMLSAGASDWRDIVDKYDIRTLMLDRKIHDRLQRRVLADPNEEWKKHYEDERVSVFVLREE